MNPPVPVLPIADPVTMSYVGTLHSFSSTKNSWSTSKPRMVCFFKANKITDVGLQQALFLNSLEDDAYRLIANLSVPQAPENKPYAELVTLFDSHFKPTESIYAARYRFHNAIRERGETLQDWSARVRNLAGVCGFTNLEENIMDRFVLGLAKGPVKDRLFEEDPKQLTLSKALTIASAKESSAHNYELTKEKEIKQEPVFRTLTTRSSGRTMKKRPDKNSRTIDTSELPSCGTCGRQHQGLCWHKNAICDICRGNHLAKVCSSQNKMKSYGNRKNNHKHATKAHFISEETLEPLYRLSTTTQSVAPYTVDIVLNNTVTLKFELDTGANASILPFSIYSQHFSEFEMKRTDTTFLTYFKDKSKPIGIVELPVRYNDCDFGSLSLFVVNVEGPPLLGRTWFEKLGFSLCTQGCSEKSRECFYNNLDHNDILNKLKLKFPSVFSEKIGCFNKGLVSIELYEGATPKFFRARPLPFSMKPLVEVELDRLVKENILEPVDYSPYGTPIVPLLKKGGGVRICGDYKVTINPYLKVDQHPLPTVEMLFQQVQGSTVFAKIDLSRAYQQLKLDKTSRVFTTISTHKGLFQYKRFPFGVASGPSKFQKKIESVLAGIEGIAILLDDILIGGKTDKDLLDKVEQVVARLEESGLTVAEDKCVFGQKSVEYLGFQIDAKGLHTTNQKVRCVVEADKPHDVKTLQAFLGFVTYISKFIPNITPTLHPLYKRLKKGVKWSWDNECDQAFKKIKELVKEHRSLSHYDPSLPLKLTVDGSSLGVAGVLSQIHPQEGELPIAFTSRALSSSEKGYSSIHREALAIIHSVMKFHIYLWGRKWTLVTDHKPLLAIFGPKCGIPSCAANRLQRWAQFLSNYMYEMEYVTSSKNIADWLSRAPLPESTFPEVDPDLTLNYVFENVDLPVQYKDVLKYSKQDPLLIKAINFTKFGWPDVVPNELIPYHRHKNELHTDKDVLMWGYRLVIPTQLRQLVLEQLHASHMGIVKCKALARAYVWWPLIDRDIEQQVASCENCAKVKDNPPKSELIPWAWPLKPWIRLHIDYCGPIHGHYILVIIDSHSKWVEAFPTKSMSAATTIKCLREIFSRFGLPEIVVSDNYPSFLSEELQNFLAKNGVKFKSGAVWCPRTNGAAENAVRTLKRAIYAALGKVDHMNSLDLVLQRFLLDYRNTTHLTTGISPAQAMLGRSLRCTLDLMRPPTTASHVQKQQENQITYHGGVQLSHFQVDDQVWARQYRTGGEKWVAGVVLHSLGPRRVEVFIPELNMTWVRHHHQLRKRASLPRNTQLLTAPLVQYPSPKKNTPDKSQSNLSSPLNREQGSITPTGNITRAGRRVRPVKRLINEID